MDTERELDRLHESLRWIFADKPDGLLGAKRTCGKWANIPSQLEVLEMFGRAYCQAKCKRQRQMELDGRIEDLKRKLGLMQKDVPHVTGGIQFPGLQSISLARMTHDK
ncbi:hypothetical protein L218DRAFT_950439 [Marasmius fiardii PR-910]|nr:hypothetical protein L218DRAFT_950439 [Marasmius fiardii PR-910]